MHSDFWKLVICLLPNTTKILSQNTVNVTQPTRTPLTGTSSQPPPPPPENPDNPLSQFDTREILLHTFLYRHPSAVITMFHTAYQNIEVGVSEQDCQTSLRLERAKVSVVAKMDHTRNFSDEIPLSLKTVKQLIGLEPKLIEKICCANCFSLHKPIPPPKHCDSDQSAADWCKDHCCTNILLANHGKRKTCNTHLYEQDRNKLNTHASKKFICQSLIYWLGTRMLWPKFEDHLDSHLQRQPSPPGTYSDIYDGERWKNFKDSENQTFTLTSGNLVFGIYLDWLNPYGIKGHSKSISIGLIFLVCFNLPSDICYKPHNIFVYGFTPTPKEPKTIQLNNLLVPLISELQQLWTGVFFTKTHNHPSGRTLKAAILLLMGDIPAQRKLSGLADHSANLFCAHCNLKSENIMELDKMKWPKKDEFEIKCSAINWLNAENFTQQKKILTEHGVKYSLCQQLPYWQASKMNTIDLMHTFILGLAKDHSVTYLGIAEAGNIISD